MGNFSWPTPFKDKKFVGDAIFDLLHENSWKGAEIVRKKAGSTAPTIVGGSKKHGGPDLGPTRAKEQWRKLGIDGMGIANSAPEKDFPADAMPRLTVRMAARIQGFPDDWKFCGSKTTQYRQVGNAFPPPVAYAVGHQINLAFRRTDNGKKS